MNGRKFAWTLMRWPDEPPEEGLLSFLGPVERDRWAAMRFEKRRKEWLLGRVTAKRLIQRMGLSIEPAAIEIHNEPEGAPYAVHAGERLPGCLSVSHRSGLAVAAWSPEGTAIGIDLEQVEARSDGFVEDYFTPAEREVACTLVGVERDEWVTLAWSAKEAVLKVLRKGLRLDTRQVEILPADGGKLAPEGWERLTARCALLESVSVFWRRQGACVLTLAVSGPAVDRGVIRVTLEE